MARIFSPTIFSLCRGFKGLFAQVFQHHHEFIAAQASNGVAFAHTRFKTLRNLLQQQIADVMAEGVVEGLEIVQIDKQQRTFSTATRTGSQCLLQVDPEEPPVGQAGQRIIERQMLDFFRSPLILVMSVSVAT